MMKIHQNAIARRNPIGQKKSSRTMNRPRDWGGRNSESSDGSTTRIPPRPSPASNRNPKTLHGSHARAVSPVKTEYQRILVKKTIRRPRASARRPRTKLPMNEPMSVAEATRKYRIGLFVGVNPNSAKIAGRTNPMRMISNATNVHANPVRMTSLRWKDVKPPCRRTSSTVRVPASTRLRTPRAYLRIRGLSNLPVTKPGFTGLGARGDWELKRRGVLRISPRELFDVRPVVRHTVRDDLSERLSQTIVVEAAGRDEIVVPVQASLQLTLMRHANPVAVHAELRVVDGVHDLDLRAVEDVDPSVVHLAHEDLVRAAFEPLTRFRPASRTASARFASIDPFVVIETSGSWRTERSMICSMSSRMSGSPPVNFTERIPNSRATRRSRSISATDISSSWGIRGFRIGPRPSSWQ